MPVLLVNFLTQIIVTRMLFVFLLVQHAQTPTPIAKAALLESFSSATVAAQLLPVPCLALYATIQIQSVIPVRWVDS